MGSRADWGVSEGGHWGLQLKDPPPHPTGPRRGFGAPPRRAFGEPQAEGSGVPDERVRLLGLRVSGVPVTHGDPRSLVTIGGPGGVRAPALGPRRDIRCPWVEPGPRGLGVPCRERSWSPSGRRGSGSLGAEGIEAWRGRGRGCRAETRRPAEGSEASHAPQSRSCQGPASVLSLTDWRRPPSPSEVAALEGLGAANQHTDQQDSTNERSGLRWGRGRGRNKACQAPVQPDLGSCWGRGLCFPPCRRSRPTPPGLAA